MQEELILVHDDFRKLKSLEQLARQLGLGAVTTTMDGKNVAIIRNGSKRELDVILIQAHQLGIEKYREVENCEKKEPKVA